MFRIYFYKKDALVVNERSKEFYFTSSEKADQIERSKILAIHPKYSLHNQADLLLEVGYRKIVVQ
ncbi:hypothetical protein LIZ91_03005 [Enterococcus avium]|jgi:hypothetical protein|uniref:hypothetical protein n=1 Tax=Enterococcus avium TaxID=33945 RepID=UPI001D086629|nr:hypothetical protein [Enterococcus avium]DAM18147.1 MAG TPA: hypothetical protein [Caudoviricetes sp.]MCB6528811.1 hypothetical protein [Enterococcus avium]MCB6915546.1 hypothetical protein [Enterococcus avium]MCG4866603.1 hypothetical protein [Enterococcus avium]MCQ4674659.1 hypothetical protein [Enterococcus avium]